MKQLKDHIIVIEYRGGGTGYAQWANGIGWHTEPAFLDATLMTEKQAMSIKRKFFPVTFGSEYIMTYIRKA